ncbi:prostaglandin E2 receptor EP3 subtype [Platysternon megacephalum]|uniref:Prostaglandin E2 receptor EP3 subtype n=1 Tax=Platysternon megacephalum TaxID=55544 RepID=A0A4D9EML4_9SAUR|nr:prostaglandin E2 receptor EP3 subtype [Platysternon megacephalum]
MSIPLKRSKRTGHDLFCHFLPLCQIQLNPSCSEGKNGLLFASASRLRLVMQENTFPTSVFIRWNHTGLVSIVSALPPQRENENIIGLRAECTQQKPLLHLLTLPFTSFY